MLKQFFDSPTFQDHAGEPSFGRRAMFWILVAMGLLAAFALCLVAWGPKDTGKQVASFAMDLLKSGGTLCAMFYGAAQASKGVSQLGALPATPTPPNPLAPNSPLPAPTTAPATANLLPSAPPGEPNPAAPITAPATANSTNSQPPGGTQ